MIALKKEKLNKKNILNEMKVLGLSLLLLYILLQMTYYKDSFVHAGKAAISLWWLLTIPGYALLLVTTKKLNSFERVVLGTGLGAALTGISSYYLGMLGIHIQYHYLIIPPAIIICSVVYSHLKKSKKNEDTHK